MNNKKSEQNVNYGQKLKKAREALGLTQEKVAEYLGLGPRYISDIERNKTKGSIDTLIKLCNIYNITPNDLLSEYILRYRKEQYRISCILFIICRKSANDSRFNKFFQSKGKT